MSRIVLEQGGMRAEIEPRVGAGIAGLWWTPPGRRRVSLMRPAPAGAAWFNDMACYLLAPWSNRIAAATFAWNGAEHPLKADWEDGTAIHGLVKDRAWKIEQRSPVSGVFSCAVRDDAFGWAFAARVSYVVGEDSLCVVLEVRNDGGGPGAMPVGLGFHPFWMRALDGGSDEVTVRVAGLKRYPCEGMIPTGEAREDEVTRELAGGAPPRAMKLDDVFAGSSHGAEILWARSGVCARYRCSEELGHTVVFTGMEGSFCLEPVTNVNDGFNLASRLNLETGGWEGTGVRGLARGESLRAEWTVVMGTI